MQNIIMFFFYYLEVINIAQTVAYTVSAHAGLERHEGGFELFCILIYERTDIS